MILADTANAQTRTQDAQRNTSPQERTRFRQDQPQQAKPFSTNVGADERAVSIAAGSIVTLMGLARSGLPRLLFTGLGGAMLYRGISGQCSMYKALGINTNDQDLESTGIHVAVSYLINTTPEDLYNRWKNMENLPSIMSNLISVQKLGEKRSRWTAAAPSFAGGQIEWEAETVRDEPNTVIAWQSLPGSSVDTRGEVRCEKALGDRGTMLHVVLDYKPPFGQTGHYIAKLFGKSADSQIKEDLRKLKRLIETGEVPTTEGQPTGSCAGS
ncbi:MAG: SRPBCC family protein [Phycisphaerae bacterium]